MFEANTESAVAQCCVNEGHKCYRYGKNKVTWVRAKEICKSKAIWSGQRLCNNQEELDECCGQSAVYDDQMAWTSRSNRSGST